MSLEIPGFLRARRSGWSVAVHCETARAGGVGTAYLLALVVAMIVPSPEKEAAAGLRGQAGAQAVHQGRDRPATTQIIRTRMSKD